MCIKNRVKLMNNEKPFEQPMSNRNCLKSCSSLVGGFVGSKSQHGSNRCSQLIWEFVITKLEMDYPKRPNNYLYIYNQIPKLEEISSTIEIGSKKFNSFEQSADILMDKMLNKKNRKNRNQKSKENSKHCDKFKKISNSSTKSKMSELTLQEVDTNTNPYFCDKKKMEMSTPESKGKMTDKSANYSGSSISLNCSPSGQETWMKRPRRQSECSVESDDSFLIIFDSSQVYIPFG